MTAGGDPGIPDWAIAFAEYREAFEERCIRLERRLDSMETEALRMLGELQPLFEFYEQQLQQQQQQLQLQQQQQLQLQQLQQLLRQLQLQLQPQQAPPQLPQPPPDSRERERRRRQERSHHPR